MWSLSGKGVQTSPNPAAAEGAGLSATMTSICTFKASWGWKMGKSPVLLFGFPALLCYKDFIFMLCAPVPACPVCVPCTCLVPKEDVRGCQIP